MILRYSDEALIEGLRQRKQRQIDYLYQEFIPIVRHFIQQKSGDQEMVTELIHEAIIILYKRTNDQSFKLSCSLKTFFISICKNLWLQHLDYKYRLNYHADFEVSESWGSYTMEDKDIHEEEHVKLTLFYKHITALPEDCQRLLDLYMLKTPYRVIARRLGFKDEHCVKTRKYTCKNLLRKKIMNDPEYHQFFEYERHGNNKRLD